MRSALLAAPKLLAKFDEDDDADWVGVEDPVLAEDALDGFFFLRGGIESIGSGGGGRQETIDLTGFAS